MTWILGGIGKAAEGIGNAINRNVKTIRGDVAERDKYEHVENISSDKHASDEQLALLAQFQAEFVARTSRTWVDSVIDAINRLPRPVITFTMLWLFVYAWWNPGSFIDLMSAFSIVPPEIWDMAMLIFSLYFGGRVLQDLRAKPKITDEQRRQALEIIRQRAEALEKATAPNIIIAVPVPEKVLPPSKLPDLPTDTTTSAAVEIMIDNLIFREGGYVNNKVDRGGPTAFGITLATLADWRGVVTTEEDVKVLKRTEAADIYRANFYLLPGIDTLPVALQAHVMDAGVNSGPRTAVRLLQRALNNLGERLAVDGVIGDATRDACRKYDMDKINNELVNVRLRFYSDLVSADPTQRVFLKGWERRARMFIAGPGMAA